MNKTVETDIEGFHPSGPGIGSDNGRTVLVWGALPGERVRAEVRKKRKRMLHALVQEVLRPSPERVDPVEEHYLSCSPWQVLAYEREHWHKQAMALSVLEAEGIELQGTLELAAGKQRLGYRNKMEFSFTRDRDNNERLSLALFQRLGRWKRPLAGCALATDEINAASMHVLEALRRAGTPEHVLKTFVVRSDRRGRALGALFVKDHETAPQASALMGGPLCGMQVWYSEPRTMASRPTELLSMEAMEGGDVFHEVLSPFGGSGVTLRSGLLGFFQINPEVFEMALRDMAPYLEGEHVVEFFAGVGAITIGAAAGGGGPQSALLVEIDPDAVEYARANIELNGLSDRFEVRQSLARRMRDEIAHDKVAVFDPPRSGLDPRTIRQLAEVRPKRIVYLSCNVGTQAADVGQLLPLYRVEFARLYNFFPRTPHVECLMVLERI
ncbi:MAG: class I SAM-dependent RNA methyltransferase [Thermodesulfovibrionales bacterium]|nr:class I SAM-dependent RNA methyltransferase [Thermodesulfovibrionales bacterium]